MGKGDGGRRGEDVEKNGKANLICSNDEIKEKIQPSLYFDKMKCDRKLYAGK